MVAFEMADCIVVLLMLIAAWKPARELKKLRSAEVRLLCSQRRDQNRDNWDRGLSLVRIGVLASRLKSRLVD